MPIAAKHYLSFGLLLAVGATLPPIALAQATDRSGAPPVQASVHWNETARGLVAENQLDPLTASRVYAFLSIAQNDATAAAQTLSSDAPRDVVEAATRAAAATASASILTALFPSSGAAIEAARRRFGEAVEPAAPAHAARSHAAAVAERVLARARSDGAPDRAEDIAPPAGAGYWRPEADRRPLLPHWGQVRPLLMASAERYVAAPPPAVGSARFHAALAEVGSLSGGLDSRRLALVHFWADGPGTATPAGHWNQIAAELIRAHGLSERAAARTFALLNIAMFDAGIACWRTKYTYWLARPSQMDSAIRPAIAVPHFPSYTSGHASFSGAAGEVLAELFPAEAERIRALAEEAALSRVYGGIHYPFDSEQGLAVGRRIGRLALAHRHAGELLPHLR